MKQTLLILSFVILSFSLSAQLSSANCQNGRYTADVFQGVTKTTGVIFGYNTVTDYSTLATREETLEMDIYEPAGDAAAQRPLMILAFGGGFIQGTRQDMDPIANALALKGYVVASIDYRLINPTQLNLILVFTTPGLLADEVVKASADMRAAIRYFKRDAATTQTFRIDTTKIFLGGASAGAIAALQTAYADDEAENPATIAAYAANGGLEGNTDLPAPNNLLPHYNSRGIAGVLNIAGGIYDTSMIDANEPPIYSAQGSADEVIPYNWGPVRYNNFNSPTTLFGSNTITTRANNIGLKNDLYTIAGGNHESPGTLPHLAIILQQGSSFIQSIVCQSALPVTLASFNVTANKCDALLLWQTATEEKSSYYTIETSADGVRFTNVAKVNSKNAANGASYTFGVAGISEHAWFRIKMVDKDGAYTYSPAKQFKPNCGPAVKVYPNPASDHAFVSGLKAGMQVSVIDGQGKLLWSQLASGNKLEIPVTRFAKGLLLVQVKDQNGQTITNTRLVRN